MEPMEKEENIDFGQLAKTMKAHKKQLGGIVLGCTALALAVAFILPKEYKSTTLVQIRETGRLNLNSVAAVAMGGGISAASTANYIELMQTRTVLDPIIDQLEEMHPEWAEDEDRKKPKAKDFAKKFLEIENTKGTNLIEVTAKGATPEEAQLVSKSVVENFLSMQTNRNQQTQSLMVKFLDERIGETKKEAEDADTKLATYSREHKIYSPDDQVKSAIEAVSVYEKAISEQEVLAKAAKAKQSAVTGELEKIKASSLGFNINDNAVVQELRSKIVEKQVELVALEQKYTAEHPKVKEAREVVSEMQASLAGEVKTIVGSNATTLNPTHGALLQQQALSVAEEAVATASKSAIEAQRKQKESELSDLPVEVVEYMRLRTDAEIKKQVYTALVQQCEQSRIQEAMEAMDVQIVDEADLPDEDEPSAPRKKLITAIGFVLGCMISLGYGLVLHKREI